MKKNYRLGNPGDTQKRVFAPNDRAPFTRRAFTYQDHAGLVLIYESLRTGIYEELWFEHHDDILAIKPDGLCDVYQVKTAEISDHKWRTVDQEMVDAITKFCALEERSSDQIATYYIYSNIAPFVPVEHAPDTTKDGSSLTVLASYLERNPVGTLKDDYAQYFDRLAKRTKVSDELLAATLRKLRFKKGRSIESFRAEVVTDITPAHPELQKWSISELKALKDRIEKLVESASTVDVPAIEMYSSTYSSTGVRESEIQWRRIRIETAKQIVRNAIWTKKRNRYFSYGSVAVVIALLAIIFIPREKDSVLSKAVKTIQLAAGNTPPPEFRESVAIIRASKKPLVGLFLTGAQLACEDLSNLDLRRLQAQSLHSTGISFDRSNLAGADLMGGELNMAKFRRAELEFAHLRNANLLSSNFYAASARFADFTGTTLHGSNMSYGVFSNANFSGAQLHLVELKKADMENADLSGAQLDDANLSETNLIGAKNLTQAMLDKACNDPNTPPNVDHPLAPSNRSCAKSEEEIFERKIKRLVIGFVGANTVTQGYCKNGETQFRPTDSKHNPENNTPIYLNFDEIDDLPDGK